MMMAFVKLFALGIVSAMGGAEAALGLAFLYIIANGILDYIAPYE